MNRRTLIAIALMAVTGCSSATTELGSRVSSPEEFAGVWRSVTPSLEFVRFSAYSTSSQAGSLGTRLTFSGVIWEGVGRIEGDSVIADMNFGGAATSSAVLVAHVRDAHRLSVSLRPQGAAPMEMDFVRDE